MIKVTSYGPFQIASRPARQGGFLAWGQRGAISSDGPLFESGEDVFFSFSGDEDVAVAEVARELGVVM